MSDARRWTGPDGTTWSIRKVDVTGEPNRGEPAEDAERDQIGALRFEGEGERLTVRTQRSGDLDRLADTELEALLERARSEEPASDPDAVRDAEARPTSGGSPAAAGRETAPHVDLEEHGPGGED